MPSIATCKQTAGYAEYSSLDTHNGLCRAQQLVNLERAMPSIAVRHVERAMPSMAICIWIVGQTGHSSGTRIRDHTWHSEL